MERQSPPVGKLFGGWASLFHQVIVGEFCGRIMCVLSIGGEDFATALLEHDLRAKVARGRREGKPGSCPHQVRAGFFRIKLRLDAVEKRSHDRP